MLRRCLAIATITCAAVACSDGPSTQANAGDAGDAGSAEAGSDAGQGGVCDARVEHYESAGQTHVELCSDVSYSTSPPTSGDHYGNWPQYKTYTTPLPYGFIVHGLEHGAVVFSYNCPDGCADEVLAAQRMIDDALPSDEACAAQGMARQRVILTPDPLLKSRWAAAAWTWSLNADCFDAVKFLEFYAAHYDHAPEQECGDGIDVGPDSGLPSPCGPPGD